MITQRGITNVVSICSKLKSLSLVKCGSRRFASTRFGSSSLAFVGKLCHQFHHLDLSGLTRITDAGLLPLLERLEEAVTPRADTTGQPDSEMICNWSCIALAKVAIPESLGNIKFIR
ncbi:hypothetical protein EJD97_005209 [Solanum chilense]|uniref:Uncharacterized protein n=1 Tax=Solanum chilense TaxID=4083 RepID=A0A6N2BZW0_SOLCI|nr:hypothetical protein EJD97_005209 [Solanum chilense]